jgi:hypothetical protein
MSLKDFLANRFFKWAANSLKGHLVLFGLTFGTGESLLGLYENYTQGTLTFSWGVWVVFVSVALGAIGGALVWYTITSPRIKRRDQRANR